MLGSALEIDDASAAEIIAGIGFKPAPLANAAASGHAINDEAVFEAGYVIKKPNRALMVNIIHGLLAQSPPILVIISASHSEKPTIL